MWVINKEGLKTFIDQKNLKMFMAKGWKAYYPELEKEEEKETKKRNNKK